MQIASSSVFVPPEWAVAVAGTAVKAPACLRGATAPIQNYKHLLFLELLLE